MHDARILLSFFTKNYFKSLFVIVLILIISAGAPSCKEPPATITITSPSANFSVSTAFSTAYENNLSEESTSSDLIGTTPQAKLSCLAPLSLTVAAMIGQFGR